MLFVDSDKVKTVLKLNKQVEVKTVVFFLQCLMCLTFIVMTFTRIALMHTPTAMTPGGKSTVQKHAGSARVRTILLIKVCTFITSLLI